MSNAAATAIAAGADAAALEDLLLGISTIILDCDGVLWLGSELLPGTVEALQRFRSLGKRLLFLTNNSSKSRRQYLEKFAALGIAAEPQEVVPSSFAAAAYLTDVGFAQGGKSVFLVGGEGVAAELEEAGIRYNTWASVCRSSAGDGSGAAAVAMQQQGWTSEAFARLRLHPGIGAVVVGFDAAFDYNALCYASACLWELPDCLFVATNCDSADTMGNGRMMPGTGCIVRAIETAAERQAVNVGKGGAWLLPFLCAQYGVRPSEACIVGDRLDTDIVLGLEGGLLTVLPLTGVTTEATLAAAGPEQLPHIVVKNLAALAGIRT